MKFGVYLPDAPADAQPIESFVSRYEASPYVLNWFQAWGDPTNSTCRLDSLNTVKRFGSIPMITWEPWNPQDSTASASMLNELLDGQWDAYIEQWAQTLRLYKRKVWLRFGHEMNGNWYPWAKPSHYANAWRYVHDRMRDAPNVEWVWCPNVLFEGAQPLEHFWPGDAYVDRVGLDGYNWGDPWLMPDAIFGVSIEAVNRLAPGLPVSVCETACTDGPEKPRWIKAVFALKGVDTVVWFNENKERNWTLDSSTPSVKAFRQALSRMSKKETLTGWSTHTPT